MGTSPIEAQAIRLGEGRPLYLREAGAVLHGDHVDARRTPAAPIRRRRSTDAAGSDAFLAGVVTSQVDGDGLQDRIGHQLSERGR